MARKQKTVLHTLKALRLSSWKRTSASPAMRASPSRRQSARRAMWPFTFIMSFRMRCDSTIRHVLRMPARRSTHGETSAT